MSQRRMFSPKIVDSDAFLDMSPSAQNLYFHLGMRADDDGFVGNPKKIMRVVGAQDDDLKLLLVKRFLLTFDSGIVVIKHWLIHNLIRSDLYTETQYKNEKATLGLNENGAYTELRIGVKEIRPKQIPQWLKNRQKNGRYANGTQTVRNRGVRLGKDRLGKDILLAPTSGAFVLKEEIKKLEDNPRRDMNVIALYLDERKPDIQSREQLQIAIRRHLRSAQSLSAFTDEQILKGVEKAKKQTPEWTIETIVKMLTK